VTVARRAGLTVIAVAALAAGVLAHLSAGHTSATFDEIILVSGGLRGVTEGRWGMVTDQPPLMMYAYGVAAAAAGPVRPSEDREWLFDDRWDYARALHFGLGNDATDLLAGPRLVGTLIALMLVAVTGAYAWWIAGPLAGGTAALLTALTPDVLAHGGIAYNDLPLALAFLLAVWALDVAVRVRTPWRAATAGLAVTAAFGVKMSALALVPVAALLIGAGVWPHRHDRAWLRGLGVSLSVGAAALYASFVVLYRGDPTLTLFRFNFWRTVLHASGGHEAPAYLLGETSASGWWYFYPVAFFLKTPAAFQVTLVLGAVGLIAAWVARGRNLESLLDWRGRGALLGALVFGAFLVRSDLNAGFRYALPLMPLLAVLAAVGVVRLWRRSARPLRGLLVGLLALQAWSVLSVYPHFLAYSSVWAGGRDVAYRALVDSSLDWGQGLHELRDFMEDEGVSSVRLSYFGSAVPDAYGIEYVALPSFFRLDHERTAGAEASPRFTVISATNLQGLYLQGRDPFASYRAREPFRVIGHSLFVYDEEGS
jgi:hypothetical protein